MKNSLKIFKNLVYDTISELNAEVLQYISNSCDIKEGDNVAIKLNLVGPFDRSKCALCTCCMELCPVGAINYKTIK